jgi:hypothetical protein
MTVNPDAEEVLNCACYDAAHMLRVSLWKDPSGPDLIITVHLTPRPLLKRVSGALRHVISRDLPYGHFEETLLQVQDVPKLRRLLDQFEQASREASSARAGDGSTAQTVRPRNTPRHSADGGD